ncbi:hypothetical protein ONE63_001029 [Megalurothrips usitatus]|uniref:RNA-directed DNA polymerase n=1 Tax=Megalurothrips usitatus TaxID=439358 RepID=A0AAV7XCZ6_9NEOP|nr:hypothetical protein ONE63_001029 [Megalurothrips usitatus]
MLPVLPSTRQTLRVQCVQRTVVPAGVELWVEVTVRRCDVWLPEAPAPVDELATHLRRGVAEDGHVKLGGGRRNVEDRRDYMSARRGPPQRGSNSAAALAASEAAVEEDVDDGAADVVQVQRMSCAVRPVDLPPRLRIVGTLVAGADGHSVQLRVCNSSSQPRALRRGACVARLEVAPEAPVRLVETTPTPTPPSAPGGALPPPLQKLLDGCSKDLADDQKAQVGDLLSEFQDVFSCTGNIGHCTLVHHDIDTGDAAPIKQPPRRLAVTQQSKADECIRDMLEKGVIAPSTSPWASPVVLLTEKSRLMDKLMPKDLSRVYLDDIVVPGKTFQEALTALRPVLLAIRSANFLLNPEKCNLFSRVLEYLGHVIDERGVSTDPKKTEKVRTWPVPKDREALRSFLGLAQYYFKFVPHFSDIAAPLHRLTEKMRVFNWTTEAQTAFDKLREALSSAPVLAFPDVHGGPFILDCDASAFALGMVLSQEQGGVERPISFHGHTLNRHQRNYCVTRLELLAVWLQSLKNTAEGQMARWVEFISGYDFVISHRPGREHGNVDALSRRPCDTDCRKCARQEHADAAVVQRLRLVDAEGPSREEVRAAQATDLDIAPLLPYLHRNRRPSAGDIAERSERTKALWFQWQSLELRDGMLCRRLEDPATAEVVWQTIVPHRLQNCVLTQFHDARGAGGHLGGYKTYAKMRQYYYWPGMRQDAKLWCLSCDTRSRKKGTQRRGRAPLRVYNVGVPWERVAIDLAGKYPRTARGNKYLLVAVDYFTRWPEAIPVPSMHSDVVARALVDNIFTRFGSPCELHSDQGRTFESAVFAKVMEIMGVCKTRTTPLHPQSDGAVERLIRTVVTQLSMCVDTYQTDWDLQAPLVLMSLRGSAHTTTGLSPAMMLFGREISLPGALVQGVPPTTRPVPTRLRYPCWLRDRLQRLHHLVRDRVHSVTLRRKERYDIRARDLGFQRGDLVWLFDPKRRRKRNPKLQSFWTGPFLIIELINDVLVKIRLQGDPKAKSKDVHVNRLAKCYSRRGTVK